MISEHDDNRAEDNHEIPPSSSEDKAAIHNNNQDKSKLDSAPSDRSTEDPPAPITAEKIAELEGKIAQLEQVHAETHGKMLRALAEAENIRKRSEREIKEARLFALQSFVTELLSVLDNLERAISSGSEGGGQEAVIEGVTLLARDFSTILERHGVQKIMPLHEKFDPHLHQAMFEVDDDSSLPPGSVAQLLQPGYSLNGRLIRPALVSVTKASSPSSKQSLESDPQEEVRDS